MVMQRRRIEGRSKRRSATRGVCPARAIKAVLEVLGEGVHVLVAYRERAEKKNLPPKCVRRSTNSSPLCFHPAAPTSADGAGVYRLILDLPDGGIGG
jgi:hypothetical protein